MIELVTLNSPLSRSDLGCGATSTVYLVLGAGIAASAAAIAYAPILVTIIMGGVCIAK